METELERAKRLNRETVKERMYYICLAFLSGVTFGFLLWGIPS